MDFRPLGDTGIDVSAICLGTMTYGEQNSEAEAHQQLDCAFDFGVNFIDTAEMYAIPSCAKTQGLTEQYIGTWLASSRVPRDRVVLATKVVGPSESMDYLRGGPRLNAEHINQAIDDSLRRLQTDYIDLYQVHWPERNTNYFGQLGYRFEDDEDAIPIEETYEVLCRLVESGKARTIGISNETPWGMAEYLRLSQESDRPPHRLHPESLQPAEPDLRGRPRRNGDTGTLRPARPTLPWGSESLTGKYQKGSPRGSRLERWNYFTRYSNPQAQAATAKYIDLSANTT